MKFYVENEKHMRNKFKQHLFCMKYFYFLDKIEIKIQRNKSKH